MIPALDARLLPEGAAQTARNVLLSRGTLAPLKRSLTVSTLGADAQSIVRHAGAWLGFPTVVHATPGPVADDRLYITGDGAPKIMVSGATRPLALEAPTFVPSVTPETHGTGDVVESTVFAVTHVTDLGEESAPSPVSGAFDLDPGEGATIAGFPSNPQPGRGITTYRIYRSVTSQTGTTALFFVADHPINSGSFTYDPSVHPINEPISTTDFNPPPDDMEGLVAMPNGMMAAFRGRELLFCEPFQPHAWPIKYRLKVDHEIMGLAAFGTMLAIITAGQPYRAEGVHPEIMQMEKIEATLPCVASRSIVDLGYGAVYASPEGIVMISPQGAQNVTRGLFTEDQWVAQAPETFIASEWRGLYVVSHQPIGAADRKLSLFDLRGEMPTLVEHDMAAVDLLRDTSTGNLHALVGARDIRQVHAPAAEDATYIWRSKVWDLPYPRNFGACKIEGRPAEAGTPAFAARIYADGELRHTSSVLNAPFRLPGSFLAEEWEIEIEGNATITRVSLGETMMSLAA